MMKTLQIIVSALFGVVLVFGFKNISAKINGAQLKSPLATSQFSLSTAPSQSLRGTLVSLAGDVEWESRIATEASQITKPQQIQQGESLVTKDDGRAQVVFGNKLTITIAPKTEVDFTQTLPSHIVLSQNSGSSEYMSFNNSSVSIQSNGLLVEVKNGDVALTVDENQPLVTVRIKNGSITAAFNDINFVTQVENVEEGNQLIFNYDTKQPDIESL